MPNTLSQSPDIISLERDDMAVWQYPTTPGLDSENPAVQARAEHLQHEYVEALARPDDESVTVETAQPLTPIREGAVNQYETVPATGEVHGYATNTGAAIDPAHAEAVVAAAQASVADAFAADPEVMAAQRAAEEQRLNREQHAAAVMQAAAYAPRIADMRDRALIDWGAEGEV